MSIRCADYTRITVCGVELTGHPYPYDMPLPATHEELHRVPWSSEESEAITDGGENLRGGISLLGEPGLRGLVCSLFFIITLLFSFPPYLIYLTGQPKSFDPHMWPPCVAGGSEGGTRVQYVHICSSYEQYDSASNASRPRDNLRKPSRH